MYLEYVRVLKVQRKASLLITCSYAIAPLGDRVLAVLGRDRILYTSLDTELGREYAARIVRGTAWNVKKLKLYRTGQSATYTIPKSFAEALDIEKGARVLAIGSDGTLQLIPVNRLVESIGPFKEPQLF